MTPELKQAWRMAALRRICIRNPNITLQQALTHSRSAAQTAQIINWFIDMPQLRQRYLESIR